MAEGEGSSRNREEDQMKRLWNWFVRLFKKAKKPTPEPVTDATAPVPVRLVHSEPCHVPDCDKSNRPRGTEKIYRIGPFMDFRVLEVGDDAFLDGFIMDAVRLQNGYIAGDDMAHSGVVYVFDHFSVKTSKDKTYTNPLKTDGATGGSFRAWWRCYKNV